MISEEAPKPMPRLEYSWKELHAMHNRAFNTTGGISFIPGSFMDWVLEVVQRRHMYIGNEGLYR